MWSWSFQIKCLTKQCSFIWPSLWWALSIFEYAKYIWLSSMNAFIGEITRNLWPWDYCVKQPSSPASQLCLSLPRLSLPAYHSQPITPSLSLHASPPTPITPRPSLPYVLSQLTLSTFPRSSYPCSSTLRTVCQQFVSTTYPDRAPSRNRLHPGRQQPQAHLRPWKLSHPIATDLKLLVHFLCIYPTYQILAYPKRRLTLYTKCQGGPQATMATVMKGL